MTESRTRPALGHKPQAQAQGDVSVPNVPFAHSEIRHTNDGIQVATPQMHIDKQNWNNMNHKLHLVLNDLLKKNGQSARKAAKACGVPLSTFNGYLKPNRHQIDPNHLLAVAKYFGVSLDYLLSGFEMNRKMDSAPTKKIFSRWVKLTIEEIAGDDENDKIDFLKAGRK